MCGTLAGLISCVGGLATSAIGHFVSGGVCGIILGGGCSTSIYLICQPIGDFIAEFADLMDCC